jgi:hypothetical protein
MIRIEIETENAAFEGSACPEVARILEMLAKCIGDEYDRLTEFDGMALLDFNGNTVGKVTVE